MDVTPIYYDLCRRKKSNLYFENFTLDTDKLNGFLKEAYAIVHQS
jgi:hypothetical protein